MNDTEITICVDCAVLAANGELPDTDTGNPADWSPLNRTDNEHIVVVGDDEPHFSWGGCDTCTTRLGGNRLTAYYINK